MTEWRQELKALAAELTEVREHTEALHRWDDNRNRKPAGAHRVILPGLLQQLYLATHPSATSQGGVTGRPKSRPPLQLEALSEYTGIGVALMRWYGSAGLEWWGGALEDNLRGLVHQAQSWPDENGAALLRDVKRWRNVCAVMTGWEKLFRPRGACPQCGVSHSLRVNLTMSTAMCHACHATWDDREILLLARAVAGGGGADLRCLQVAAVSSQ